MGKKLEIRAVPINTIKQIMRRKVTSPISKDAVISISKHLEEYIENIGEVCSAELNFKNKNPNKPNHYVYTKIDKEIVKRAINRLRIRD